MNLNPIQRRCRSWLFLLSLCCLFLPPSSQAATLNVTDHGVIGDTRDIFVSVTTNSAVVVTTNIFTSADVGKVMQLFGAGYYSSLSNTGGFRGNYHGTPTNHQDMVVRILSVANGTNVTISSPCGVTTNNIRCTYGTENRVALISLINAAGSNDVIYFPAGNYMLVPPKSLDPNFIMANVWDSEPAINLQKSSLTFRGDGTNNTILTGVGAWQQKGRDQAWRGSLFTLRGPVTNNGSLIFDNLQFNGNATRQRGPYTFWPAIPTDGSGWDMTHHALTDAVANSDDYKYIGFTNCLFTRWHGETIQGISQGSGDPLIDIGNCTFVDGNSTVININKPHDFHHNLVTDYYQVAEDGQFTPSAQKCYIRNNVFSNIYGSAMIALTGASTNVSHAGYIIASNVFKITAPKYGIITAGAKHISVISNYVDGGGIALGMAGQQGTDYNRDYLIANNVFTNAQTAIFLAGSGNNRIENVLATNNSATVSINFAIAGQGAGAWFTNVVFRHNTANRGMWSTWATGQYLIDELSNDFPFRTVTGTSNVVTYAWGARHNIAASVSGSVLHLDNSNPAQIPPAAVLQVTNSGVTATLFTSLSAVNPITMPSGYSARFRWTNGVWRPVFNPVWNPNLRAFEQQP